MDWTMQEKQLLKEALEQGLKPLQIKNNYLPHRSTDAIRSQSRAVQDFDCSTTSTDDEQFRLLKRQNDSLLKSLRAERAKSRLLIEAVQESVAKLQVKPVKPPVKEKSKRNLEFHALRSDEQVGQSVDPTRTQMVSHYNIDIYRQRSQLWCDKVCTFREEDKNSHGLNKLIINNLGDHVEGEAIYPGQAFQIDRPTIDQMLVYVETEARNLVTLCSVFPEISVFCIPGNHGRAGFKGQHNEKTNWDYVCMHFLRLALQNQPNIKFYISNDPVMIVQHGRFNFCLKHGENIRSYSGTPFYGLDRDFRKLNSLYNMIIHYEVIGHHHRAANLEDNIIINGCFPGGSDLSINKMSLASIASQKIFYFHPIHGSNRWSDLYLSKAPELKADETGVYTSYYHT